MNPEKMDEVALDKEDRSKGQTIEELFDLIPEKEEGVSFEDTKDAFMRRGVKGLEELGLSDRDILRYWAVPRSYDEREEVVLLKDGGWTFERIWKAQKIWKAQEHGDWRNKEEMEKSYENMKECYENTELEQQKISARKVAEEEENHVFRDKWRIQLAKIMAELREKEKVEGKDYEKIYKRLAMKFHPDRGGDGEIMKTINRLRDEGIREDLIEETIEILIADKKRSESKKRFVETI